MANNQLKPVASLLLVLNFCLYVIILGIGGWAMNRAIDHGFIIGKNRSFIIASRLTLPSYLKDVKILEMFLFINMML